MRSKIHVLVKCLSACEGTWSKRIYFDICTLTGNRPTFNFTRAGSEKNEKSSFLWISFLGVCVCGVCSITRATTTTAICIAYTMCERTCIVPISAGNRLIRRIEQFSAAHRVRCNRKRVAYATTGSSILTTYMPLVRISTTSARINSNATRYWALALGYVAVCSRQS